MSAHVRSHGASGRLRQPSPLARPQVESPEGRPENAAPLASPAPDARGLATLEEEALRVYRRYQREMVEGLRLCPWAERAREGGAVTERVIVEEPPLMERSLEAIADLASAPSLEIGLLIYPRVTLDPVEFDRFVAELVEQDSARWPLGEVPFAMAAFHPFAPLDAASPARLVPFTRRTPDPTIQLVRLEALERVRQGASDGTQFMDLESIDLASLVVEESVPMRERVARTNLRTVERLGADAVSALFDDIRRDRDLSYRRFGVPPRVDPERREADPRGARRA